VNSRGFNPTHILVSDAGTKGNLLLTKLSESVAMIDTRALGEPNVVAAYVVTGKETAVIDMGYQSSAEHVASCLTQNRVTPDYLLPTHVHLDHSGSCGTLAGIFENATIMVHPKGEPHLIDPSRLWKGATELFGGDLMQRYGRPEPISEKRVRVALDGEIIDLGREITLRTVWTPGHASHHLSYEWEQQKAFFTGDAVGICFPKFPVLIPTTPPTSFNLERTLQSLDRMRDSSPVEFYTPHYGVVRNAMQWITENANCLQNWRKTVGKMKESGWSPEQISTAQTDEVARLMHQATSNVPDYLRVSIKISVLGFLRYLSR
jgi:glyoxylase-like metal-dependent hydrolase (beta-lactamase superfamily II)